MSGSSLEPYDLLLLLRDAPEIVVIVNGSRTVCYCSVAVETVLGHRADTLLGKNLFTLIHPEDIPSLTAALDTLAQGPRIVRPFLFRGRHNQGVWRTLEGSGIGRRDSRNDFYITLMLRDVTEHKWIEERSKLARREWEQTIDALSDCVFLTDTAGAIRRCNRAVSQAFRLPYADLIDRPIRDVLYQSPETVAPIFHTEPLLAATQESDREEIYLLRVDRWFAVTRYPVRRSGSESLQGFVYILTDITERKHLEDMLRTRVVRPQEVAPKLREFRKTLSLSQKAFGQEFGGYSQRQMNSYESGEIEIPLGLLLAIKNKGYSLDVVLAPRRGDTINRIVHHLSFSHRTRLGTRQLLQTLGQILEQEQRTLQTLLTELGFPRAALTEAADLFAPDLLSHTTALSEGGSGKKPRPPSRKA